MPAEPLTALEREETRVGIERGEPDGVIGVRLGWHRVTINAEIGRNGGRVSYTAIGAQARSDKARVRSNTVLLAEDVALAAHVTARLKAKGSPVTISIELARGTHGVTARVSHETIYAAIYEHGDRGLDKGLHKHLQRRRRCRKHRLPTGTKPAPKTSPLGQFSLISARPAGAAGRGEVGNLEGDLITGEFNRSALVTVFDRCSSYIWLADFPEDHGKDVMLAAMTDLLERISEHFCRALTYDQGVEMARHAEIAELCGIDICFADPHSPWQRPTNENGRGLLRRYVGKSTNFGVSTPEDLRHIEHRINAMPRRSLDPRHRRSRA